MPPLPKKAFPLRIYESRIRERAAHLALTVREEVEGPFEGRSLDGRPPVEGKK